MNSSCLQNGYDDGRYVLPPLPYGDSALEPLICAETLYLHHDKHHAAYVAGANAALETLQLICEGSLSSSHAVAAGRNLAFNLGGHILHTLYWGNLAPKHLNFSPEGVLAEAIDATFGSYASFVEIFSALALGVQGNGWAVLGTDPISHRLMMTGISNHHEVLVPGFCPLLVCDVWEHAYYLTWSNDRKGYINAFMQHVNWPVVNERYEKILRHEF